MTSKVRVLLPPPRFALTGYAWRSHAESVRAKRARRSLRQRDGLCPACCESVDGLVQTSQASEGCPAEALGRWAREPRRGRAIAKQDVASKKAKRVTTRPNTRLAL